MPLENVLIEDCKVSGYDAGSVYAKTYTNEKLVAEDRCGPTGRVKLGTEFFMWLSSGNSAPC